MKKQAPLAAAAFWSAPVLWRFRMSLGHRKAPEGWSTPKRSRAEGGRRARIEPQRARWGYEALRMHFSKASRVNSPRI